MGLAVKQSTSNDYCATNNFTSFFLFPFIRGGRDEVEEEEKEEEGGGKRRKEEEGG